MNTNRKNIPLFILQIVAIVVLVLAVLSTAATLIVRSSVDSAAQQQQVPSSFGKEFLPALDAKFEKININNGSLILLKDIGEDGVKANDVVVFNTPVDFNDNSIYKTFSVGRVIGINTDGGTPQYSIEGLGTNGDVVLEETAVLAIAGWQVPGLGNTVSGVIGSAGIIYFIVVPFFAFIVLQLLVVILRMVRTPKQEADEQDDGDEDEVPVVSSASQNESDRRYDSLKESAPPADSAAYVPQEPLEPIALKFKKKEVQAAFQDVKSQTFTTIPPVDVPSFTKREVQQSIPAAPIAAEPEPVQPVKTIAAEKPVSPEHTSDVSADISRILSESIREVHKGHEPVNPVFGLLDEQRSPDRSDEFRSVLDMVDSLLSDIKEEQKNDVRKVAQEFEQGATQEFKINQIRDRLQENHLLDQHFVQNEKSQEILDNILIELKDNALDVQFRNVKSKAVDIEKTETGDGFTIDTPKYKANVKIEMDKK